KRHPQHVRGRHRPDSPVLAVKRMNPQRRVLLIVVEQTERLQELAPIPSGEVAAGEASQELLAELERPVASRHLTACGAGRLVPPAAWSASWAIRSNSASVNCRTRPSRTS